MIKVCASMSKKLPLPQVPFSSQQVGLSVEIELGEGESREQVAQRIAQLYSEIQRAIEAQFRTAIVPVKPEAVSPPETSISPASESPSPVRRRSSATSAQRRAIASLARQLGVDLGSVLAHYNVDRLEALSVPEASALIDDLRLQPF